MHHEILKNITKGFLIKQISYGPRQSLKIFEIFYEIRSLNVLDKKMRSLKDLEILSDCL